MTDNQTQPISYLVEDYAVFCFEENLIREVDSPYWTFIVKVKKKI